MTKTTHTARRWAFVALSAAFASAALFHLAALARPAIELGSPPGRHAVFVAIDLTCALGFLRRPMYFVVAFAVLVVQQLLSHGAELWASVQQGRGVDVPSVAVAIVMPFALALLITDRTRTQR